MKSQLALVIFVLTVIVGCRQKEQDNRILDIKIQVFLLKSGRLILFRG